MRWNISWKDVSRSVIDEIEHASEQSWVRLTGGFEAETWRVGDYVIKVWTPENQIDAQSQYEVLQSARMAGSTVAEPLAWGMDECGNGVLVTAYAGEPLRDISTETLRRFAEVQYQIHMMPTPDLGLVVPTPPEMLDALYVRHFPGIEQFPDLEAVLMSLKGVITPRAPQLIHGDYNPGNVLLDDGQYTVIDWTFVQVNDARYDIAWAVFTLWQQYGDEFSSRYREMMMEDHGDIGADQMDYFECIAGLRWLLLSRLVPFFRDEDIQSVKGFVKERLPHNMSHMV